MQIGFRETPLDLFFCALYSIGALAYLLLSGSGSPVAALLIVFVPGYTVLAAVFPGKNQISWGERIALSFALSIAIVAVLGLALDFTLFGIRFASIVVSVSLLNTVLTGLAYLRRTRLQADTRLALDLELRRPLWSEYQHSEKLVVVALIAGILLAGGALGYIVVSSSQGVRFTELYLLGPGGNASGYPTDLKVDEQGTAILNVVNHEGITLDYALRVDLMGVRFVYNASAGHNDTLEENRTNISSFDFALPGDAVWTHPYSFSIHSVGLWKIQFLLFKSGDFSSAYRQTQFYVTVT